MTGMWVCIDGVEGAGKTTLTQGLAASIDMDAVNEFSDAPFGAALREAVKTAPHFISGSAVAQSLVFLGDFVELVETKVLPALQRDRLVVTDRGYVSKWAYQRTVLERAMSADDANMFLGLALSVIPVPDLTIYLRCPPPILQARLLDRDGSCDSARLQFIDQADIAGLRRLAHSPFLRHEILKSDQSREDVLARARKLVEAADVRHRRALEEP